MSVPTPVTTSAMTAETGSSAKAALTSKAPTGIHSNRTTRMTRPFSGISSRRSQLASEAAKARAIAAVATQPANLSPRLQPKSRFASKPIKGNANMRVRLSMIPRPYSFSRLISSRSVDSRFL